MWSCAEVNISCFTTVESTKVEHHFIINKYPNVIVSGEFEVHVLAVNVFIAEFSVNNCRTRYIWKIE